MDETLEKDIFYTHGINCLAYLNELINHTDDSCNCLTPYRDAIAKFLIENGVSQKDIHERINHIHNNCQLIEKNPSKYVEYKNGNRALDDLDYDELESLQEDYKAGMRYNDIRVKYNLKPYLSLNSNLLKVTQKLKDDMLLEEFEWKREDAEEVIADLNLYRNGLVFWDKERDLENLEDLADFLEYTQWDFEEILDYVRIKNLT